MRLGNKEIISFFLSFFLSFSLFAEDKIISTPLINLNELKPSFEETDDSIKDLSNSGKLKDRKKIILQNKSSSAKFIGLDKITAKTSDILINLGETKKFGPLEIKVLECGKIRSKNNVNWMNILRLAFKLDPKSASKIMKMNLLMNYPE